MRFWPFSVSLGHKVSPVGHSICYIVHGNDLLCLIEFILKVCSLGGNAVTESLSLQRQHLHQIISCDPTSQPYFILTFDNLSLKSSRWGEDTCVNTYIPNTVAGAAVHTLQAVIQSECMCIHQIMLHNCIQLIFHHTRGNSSCIVLSLAPCEPSRPHPQCCLTPAQYHFTFHWCHIMWCIFIKPNVRILGHFIIDFDFKFKYCVYVWMCVCSNECEIETNRMKFNLFTILIWLC